MGDTLFGKEVSGTSLETRGLARQTSGAFSNLINDPNAGAQRIADTFGLDVGELGLTEFTRGILSGQSPALAGFEAANAPFQRRALASTQANLSAGAGSGGGRFSRNLLGARSRAGSEQQAEFDRNRFSFVNQSRATDVNALSSILGSLPALQQGALAPLVAAGQYANPGAPIYQEGIAGDIISGLGAVGGAAMGNPAAFSAIFGGGGSPVERAVNAGLNVSPGMFQVPDLDPNSLFTFPQYSGYLTNPSGV